MKTTPRNVNPSTPSRKRATGIPPKTESALETYIQAIQRTANNHLEVSQRHRLRDNLTRDERIALKSLQNRTDIVIKPADKGSAVVVMSREDYVAEANRQLSDDQYYHPLDTDPTETISSEIRSFLTEMAERGTIDSSTKAFLTPLNPRPGRFYMLPKIHKPNNPGRPIISSCDAPTEKISMFVDHHLHPHVEQLPSYLRDTTHFLTRIQGLDTPPPGTLLVTLDVKSLYTNIPHADGIEACREALNTRTHLQPPTEDLIELTRLVLTKNIFTFAGQHYLQTHGTAMGTHAAPSYANIFMGRLENQILAEVDKKPHVWWRYIDDVFAMWTHGENHLKDFLEHLNQAYPAIKFTADWSPDSVSFLDVTITLKDGEVQTDLYSKPTDMHQYLAMSSCHPWHCKQAIPYGQALRLRRICSEEHQFKQRTTELKQYLIRRGHNPAQVQQSIDKAAACSPQRICPTTQ